MITVQTTQPRDLNSWRAAGLLYGDLGTSKAYVLGLAFALAGYASFWYIFAVSVLTLLVGVNYIFICKFYPAGGGVYASVRDRSRVLSVVGAFFLISDYLVTAALSALSAFHYLGVFQPELWAVGAIIIIGLFNFLGPKQTGSLAIALAIPTVLCVLTLGALSLPFLPKAIHHLKPISHDYVKDWNIFVGIIVALSGIEAIANTTSSMKLDPGSSQKKPSIYKTATPAIVMVIIEVCFFTTLLGLAMNALPGLEISNGTVNAPGYPDVRDSMLRYLGESFAGELFGLEVGKIVGIVVSLVITLLLLSAVNTAMIALSSLLFVMSRDGEMPLFFQKLNTFGVPKYALSVAFLIPVGILMVVSDVAGLANLYAIGFVGAIAVNLGATSTNFKLPLTKPQRVCMFATCMIMFLIEVSLFMDKPAARGFVMAIIGAGLLMRALVAEQKAKEKELPQKIQPPPFVTIPKESKETWLVAVTGINKSLDYAITESLIHQIPLYVLFVREQKVMVENDHSKFWMEDPEAQEVYQYVTAKISKHPTEFLYTVTAHTAFSISEVAKEKSVAQVIIGRGRKSSLLHVLRGTTVRDLARVIPSNIELIVIY